MVNQGSRLQEVSSVDQREGAFTNRQSVMLRQLLERLKPRTIFEVGQVNASRNRLLADHVRGVRIEGRLLSFDSSRPLSEDKNQGCDFLVVGVDSKSGDVAEELDQAWSMLVEGGHAAIVEDSAGTVMHGRLRQTLGRFALERGVPLNRLPEGCWLLRKGVTGIAPNSSAPSTPSLPEGNPSTASEFLAWYNASGLIIEPGKGVAAFASLTLGARGPGVGEVVSLGNDLLAAFVALGSKQAGREIVTVVLPGRSLRAQSLAAACSDHGSHPLDALAARLQVTSALNTVSEEAIWTRPIRLLQIEVTDSRKALRKAFERWSPWVVEDGLICLRPQSQLASKHIDHFCAQVAEPDQAFSNYLTVDGLRVLQKHTNVSTSEETSMINRFASRCKILVLHHAQPPRIEQPYLKAIHLGQLPIPAEFQDNRLAESRVYLWEKLLDYPQEYLGFATGRWDEKWHQALRLNALHRLDCVLAPKRVFAPLPTKGAGWLADSEACHPGLGALIQEIAAATGIALSDHPTLWANNFICHRDVVRDFLRVWKRMFAYCYGKYGLEVPFSVGSFDARRPFGYLAERFTMLYFSSRADLTIVPL